jgi:hypothetical protein
VVVDELALIARIGAEDRERELANDVLDGLEDPPMASLFLTERLMLPPVKTSVTVRVKQNSPLELPPCSPPVRLGRTRASRSRGGSGSGT